MHHFQACSQLEAIETFNLPTHTATFSVHTHTYAGECNYACTKLNCNIIKAEQTHCSLYIHNDTCPLITLAVILHYSLIKY